MPILAWTLAGLGLGFGSGHLHAAPPLQGGSDAPGGLARDYSIRELVQELSSVAGRIQERHRQLDRLETRLPEGQPLTGIATLPANWPVRSGYISSQFGFRIHPNRGRRVFHEGVDFAGPHGTPILAIADGVVTFSGRHGDYGLTIDIRHPSGLVTRYAHNQSNRVQEGDRVRQGQTIAALGATGNATGSHLHFEVLRDGRPIDPMRILDARSLPRLAER